MSDDKQMTPEEKLLKVIQGGGDPGKGADTPRSAAAAKPSAPAAASSRDTAFAPKAAAPAPPSVASPPPAVSEPTGAVPSRGRPATPPTAAASPRATVSIPKPTAPADPAKPAAAPSRITSSMPKPTGATPEPTGAIPVRGRSTIPNPAAASRLTASIPKATLAAEAAKDAAAAAQAQDAAGQTRARPQGEETAAAAAPPKAGSFKKKAKRQIGVRAAGFWLAASILALVCLTSYEIWAGIQRIGSLQGSALGAGPAFPTPDGGEAANPGVGAFPYELEKVLAFFNTGDRFRYVDRGVNPTNAPTANKASWVEAAKKLKFMATMGKEPNQQVILVDTARNDAMGYYRIGEAVLTDWPVKVIRIDVDKVIIGDGQSEYPVK